MIPVNKSENNIHTSITYASIVQIEDNVSKEELEKIVLINVPKKIYNNLRDAFIFSFESCGFKDIKIDKEVDFEKLYLSRKTSKKFFLSSFFKNFSCLSNSSLSGKTIFLEYSSLTLFSLKIEDFGSSENDSLGSLASRRFI